MTIARLVRWTLFGTSVNAVSQFGKLAFMARELPPEELGVYAIVVAAAAFIYLFQDFGLSSFYVHKKFVPERLHVCLFKLSFVFGLISCFALIALAFFLGYLYGSEVVFWSLALLSVNYLILGLMSQHQAILIKERSLRLLAICEVVASIVSFSLFAFLLSQRAGVYAYVISVVVYSLTKLLIVYSNVDWRPKLRTKTTHPWRLRSAINYGAYQLSGQLVNHLRSRLDVFILGKLVGLELMGLYGLAKETVTRPQGLLQPVVSRVTLPLFAQKLHAGESIGEFYCLALRKISFAHFFIFSALIVLSDALVAVVYAKDSDLVGELIRLLCIFGYLRSLGMPIGAITQATGKTKLDLKWNLIALVFGSLPLLSAGWLDISTTALFIVVMQFALTNLSYFVIIKPCLEKVSYMSFLKTWVFPFFWILVIYGAYVYGL